MDIPPDSFCPIIFGRSILKVVKDNSDCKHETISLKFGWNLIKFHFSKFNSKQYYKDLEEKEGKTIADLVATYVGTPKDDVERRLLAYE